MSEIFSQFHVFRIPLLFISVSCGTISEITIHKNLEFTQSSAGRMFEHILSVFPPSNKRFRGVEVDVLYPSFGPKY